MSTELGYSMFQDVLFPADQIAAVSADVAELRLRRLKRYIPEPELDILSAPLVVFDLETTGLDFGVDRIIEIGAIKLVDFQPVAEFSTLVRTDLELTDDIVKLTGITNEMLVGQPEVDSVLHRFFEFIEGSILVAHNAEFDLGMVRAAASRMGIDLEWPCFCTLKMARELLPQLENKKLDTLARHYNLTFEARHRSIGDVKVTTGVLGQLMRQEGASLRRWAQMSPFSIA